MIQENRTKQNLIELERKKEDLVQMGGLERVADQVKKGKLIICSLRLFDDPGGKYFFQSILEYAAMKPKESSN